MASKVRVRQKACSLTTTRKMMLAMGGGSILNRARPSTDHTDCRVEPRACTCASHAAEERIMVCNTLSASRRNDRR